jgi:uncharacterized protein
MTTQHTFESVNPHCYSGTLLTNDECYFVSGSNHPGEIRGLMMSGNNVGVAAPHVTQAVEDELFLYAGGFAKVFVDSGAFSEVEFGATGPVIAHPIDDAAWTRILDLYERLASMGWRRHQLYVVAPDCVGFQDITLARLAKYADRIRAIKAAGANIIVPVQKGAMSMADFAHKATEILGTDDVVWGVPSKKDATTVADLTAFVTDVQPNRIHLLGLGTSSKRFPTAVKAVRAACSSTIIFSDSVRITAMVGRTGKTPRKLTAATDQVKAEGICKNATEWKAASLFRVMMAEHDAYVAASGCTDGELVDAPVDTTLAELTVRCPKCNSLCPKDEGSVGTIFGWRKVAGKKIRQSYCRRCRAN